MKDLIVPDIHGRVFWKSILPFLSSDKYEKVIFLGDYVDPYISEGYHWNDAIKALIDVIYLKRQYKNKIVLLLGNHDLGYIDARINACRRDIRNYDIIRTILLEYSKDFDLLYDKPCSVENITRVLYSHAGITNDFYRVLKNSLDINESNIVTSINQMWHESGEKRELIKLLLSYVGELRGGEDVSGSFVWADVTEHDLNNLVIPYTYQIFGHSQTPYAPIIGTYCACLDTRQVFDIDYDTLEIKVLNGTS
jgi:hypothetical protein